MKNTTRRKRTTQAPGAADRVTVCVLWLAVLGAEILLAASGARAEAMDPDLSRLRIATGEGACEAPAGYCPDQPAFERLVVELAAAYTMPVVGPAHSDGPAGTYAGLSTTVTTLSLEGDHWQRGVVGEPDQDQGALADPNGSLFVHRLHFRQGLPFGLEVGAALGFIGGTSMWTIGAQLKLALFEGFRSRWGMLPDVSVRLSWDALVGAPDLDSHVLSADLVLSKPFVLAAAWRLAPLLGMQLSGMHASSDTVDLTPERDAHAMCAPAAGGTAGSPMCTGEGADLGNLVEFEAVQHARLRFLVGAGMELELVRVSASVVFDLPGMTPRLDAATPAGEDALLAAQVAASLSAGVSF